MGARLSISLSTRSWGDKGTLEAQQRIGVRGLPLW